MGAPDAEFVALVRDALEHLYDPAHLSRHPLAAMLLPERLPPGVTTPKALQQALLDAIDDLNPGSALPVGARERRAQQVLELRYVEALPIREAIAELGLSQAQHNRDLRHALDSLSALLYGTVESSQRLRADSPGPVEADVAPPAPAGSDGPLVDLNELISGIVDMVRLVAQESGVLVTEDPSPVPVLTQAGRMVVRQIMITLAGFALAGARGGKLTLSSRRVGQSAKFDLVYHGNLSESSFRTVDSAERLSVARQLLHTLGGGMEVDVRSDSLRIAVELPGKGRSLLIVEDNPDAVRLISRLIADQGYTILSAGTVREGLELARRSRPTAVILDIMIPGQDGWDGLQSLKHDPSTQGIPVLVCSVLGESQLALALGAAGFLRKPLTRPALLDALAALLDPQPPPEAASPAQPESTG